MENGDLESKIDPFDSEIDHFNSKIDHFASKFRLYLNKNNQFTPVIMVILDTKTCRFQLKITKNWPILATAILEKISQ